MKKEKEFQPMQWWNPYTPHCFSSVECLFFRALYAEIERVEEILETVHLEDVKFQHKRIASYKAEIKAVRNERDKNSLGIQFLLFYHIIIIQGPSILKI